MTYPVGIKVTTDTSGLQTQLNTAERAFDRLGREGQTAGEQVASGVNRGRDALGRFTSAVPAGEQALARLGREGQQAGEQVARGMTRAENSANGLGSTLARAGKWLAGFFAVGMLVSTALSVGRIADAYANAEARLAGATRGTVALGQANAQVLAIAQATSTDLVETSSLAGKLTTTLRDLGAQGQAAFTGGLELTRTINQATQVSGASAQASSAALTQLGQALNQGQLRGEELNSVLEQSPRLARAIADGLNVPIGALREMAEAGELTSAKVIGALRSQASVIDAEFARMPMTIGRGWQQAENAVMAAIGRINSQTSAGVGIGNLLAQFADAVPQITAVGMRIGEVWASEISRITTDTSGMWSALGDNAPAFQQVVSRAAAGLAVLPATFRAAADIGVASFDILRAGVSIAFDQISAGGRLMGNSIESSVAASTGQVIQLVADMAATALRSIASLTTGAQTLASAAGLDDLAASLGNVSARYTQLATLQDAVRAGIAQNAAQYQAEAAAIADTRDAAIGASVARIDFARAEITATRESYAALVDNLGATVDTANATDDLGASAAGAAADLGQYTGALTAATEGNKKLGAAEKQRIAEYRELSRANIAEETREMAERDRRDRAAGQQFERLMRAQAEASRRAAEEARRPWIQAADGMSQAIGDFVAGGMRDFSSFADAAKNVFRQLMADLVQQVVATPMRQAFMQLFQGAAGGMQGPGGGGGLLGLLSSVLGGTGRSGAGAASGPFAGATSMGSAGLGGLGSIGSALGAGAIGATAGGAIAGQFGNRTVGTVLGGLGATAGMIIGGPIGAAIGAAAGAVIGSLFRGAWEQNGGGQSFNVGAAGGTGNEFAYERRNRGLLRGGGSDRRTVNSALDAEAAAQIAGVFESISATIRTSAAALGVDAAEMISGSFSVIRDKKGEIISQTSQVLGAVYTESFQAFQQRLGAENIIAQVGVAAGNASEIAQRWRASASTLADGATLLLAAQIDISRGIGLLGDGSLEQVVDVVERLRGDGETLAATYGRVSQSVALMRGAFDVMRQTFDGGAEALAVFSSSVVQMLGGIEQAASAFNTVFNEFFTAEERAQASLAAAQRALGQVFQSTGIDPNITREQYRAALQQAMAAGNSELVTQLLTVGQAMAAAAQAERDLATARGATVTATTNAAGDERQQAARIGESASSFNQWVDGLRDQLGQLTDTRNPFQQLTAEIRQFADESAERIRAYYDPLIAVANATGDAAQAARLQADAEGALGVAHGIAASRARAAIAELMRAASGNVASLYGAANAGGTGSTVSAFGGSSIASQVQFGIAAAIRPAQVQQAQIAAQVARAVTQIGQKSLGSSEPIRLDTSRLASEWQTSVIEPTRSAMLDIVGSFSEAWGNSVRALRGFVDSLLIGELSPLTPGQQYQQARAQYEALLARARGGDEEAAAQLQGAAQAFLQTSRTMNASTSAYTRDFNSVLRELGELSALAGLGSASSAGGGSGGGGDAGAGVGDLGQSGLSAEQRAGMVLELIGQVRDLRVASGQSLGAVLERLNIPLGAFAADLGLQLGQLNGQTLAQLGVVSNQFGVELSELGQTFGIEIGSLLNAQSIASQALGATLSQLPAGVSAGLAPLLEVLRNADTAEAQLAAMQAIEAYIRALPPEQADALAPFFDDIDPAEGAENLGALLTGLNTTLGSGLSSIATGLGTIGSQVTAGLSSVLGGIQNQQQAAQVSIEGAVANALQQIIAAINGDGGTAVNSAPAALASNTAAVQAQTAALLSRLDRLESSQRDSLARLADAQRDSGGAMGRAIERQSDLLSRAVR